MNEERVLELIYPLLDEYDRSIWEDIRYIDLANAWLKIVDESLDILKKKHKRISAIDIIELEELRRKMLLDYLKGNVEYKMDEEDDDLYSFIPLKGMDGVKLRAEVIRVDGIPMDQLEERR